MPPDSAAASASGRTACLSLLPTLAFRPPLPPSTAREQNESRFSGAPTGSGRHWWVCSRAVSGSGLQAPAEPCQALQSPFGCRPEPRR